MAIGGNTPWGFGLQPGSPTGAASVSTVSQNTAGTPAFQMGMAGSLAGPDQFNGGGLPSSSAAQRPAGAGDPFLSQLIGDNNIQIVPALESNIVSADQAAQWRTYLKGLMRKAFVASAKLEPESPAAISAQARIAALGTVEKGYAVMEAGFKVQNDWQTAQTQKLQQYQQALGNSPQAAQATPWIQQHQAITHSQQQLLQQAVNLVVTASSLEPGSEAYQLIDQQQQQLNENFAQMEDQRYQAEAQLQQIAQSISPGLRAPAPGMPHRTFLTDQMNSLINVGRVSDLELQRAFIRQAREQLQNVTQKLQAGQPVASAPGTPRQTPQQRIAAIKKLDEALSLQENRVTATGRAITQVIKGDQEADAFIRRNQTDVRVMNYMALDNARRAIHPQRMALANMNGALFTISANLQPNSIEGLEIQDRIAEVQQQDMALEEQQIGLSNQQRDLELTLLLEPFGQDPRVGQFWQMYRQGRDLQAQTRLLNSQAFALQEQIRTNPSLPNKTQIEAQIKVLRQQAAANDQSLAQSDKQMQTLLTQLQQSAARR